MGRKSINICLLSVLFFFLAGCGEENNVGTVKKETVVLEETATKEEEEGKSACIMNTKVKDEMVYEKEDDFYQYVDEELIGGWIGDDNDEWKLDFRPDGTANLTVREDNGDFELTECGYEVEWTGSNTLIQITDDRSMNPHLLPYIMDYDYVEGDHLTIKKLIDREWKEYHFTKYKEFKTK